MGDGGAAASVRAVLGSGGGRPLDPGTRAFFEAGLGRGLEPLHTGTPGDWDEMVDTNVKGLLYVTRAVTPGMVERRRGHVINLGSVAGHEVYPGGAVYCATKHAVDAITRGLRMDLLGTGVRVSTVDPGMVETEFSVVRFRGDRERADRVYRDMTPLTAADIVWSLDPRTSTLQELAARLAEHGDRLTSLGIPVFSVKTEDTTDVFRAIRNLGVLTGLGSAADSLSASVRGELDVGDPR